MVKNFNGGEEHITIRIEEERRPLKRVDVIPTNKRENNGRWNECGREKRNGKGS